MQGITLTKHGMHIMLTVTKHPVRGKSTAECLLDLCLKHLGKTEMAMRGSRWRWRAEKHPLKLEKVLGELKAVQLEGKAVRNPGAYAEDLWKRFT